jgi:hypothetical protein
MTFNTVILDISARLHGRLTECVIFVHFDILAYEHRCQEHLLRTVCKLRGVSIRVGTIISKVDSFSPQALIAIINVEAFLALVNNFRWSITSSMEQFFNDNRALIFEMYVLHFMLEDAPELVILNSFNLFNSSIWHCCHKFF